MSKMFIVVRSEEFAAIDRPSGDQRGSVLPTDPGSVVTRRLARSKMRISLFGSCPPNEEQKAILLPSGDQSGSACTPPPSGSSLRGIPPSTVTVYASLSSAISENRICVPSGDQRGMKTFIDGALICMGLLPSRLAFQRIPSG